MTENAKMAITFIVFAVGRMSPYATIGSENFVLLYEQGVRLAFANDSIPPCTVPSMGFELVMFDHVLKSEPHKKLFDEANQQVLSNNFSS